MPLRPHYMLAPLASLLFALSAAGVEPPTREITEFVPLYPTEGHPLPRTRSGLTGSKLSPDLEALYEQFVSDPDADPVFSPEQLRTLFGIDPDSDAPRVGLQIRLAENADIDALRAIGLDIHVQVGDLAQGTARVQRLRRIGLDPSVAAVELSERLTLPILPAATEAFVPMSPTRSAGPIDLGATGKGVFVGIIDSGIDFRHPDFIDANGRTRIVALYDLFDETHAESNGAIGLPGFYTEEGNPKGTIYTRADLNRARRGELAIPHRDRDGHGTAVAGVAAGGGRATANAAADPARYRGIAPDAELIIVSVSPPGVNGAWHSAASLTQWVIDVARQNQRPVVINMSFGNHRNPHDGTELHERVLDGLAGPGIPGVAIVVAAGNNGEQSFHASGRFGPRQPGQLDVDGTNVELFVSAPTLLDAYFSRRDDWGLGIAGLDAGLTDADGRPQQFLIVSRDGAVQVMSSDNLPESERTAFMQTSGLIAHNGLGNQEQRVSLTLPPGRYVVWGFGMPDRFEVGRFALYLPQVGTASFGRGAERRHMTAAPGNATNVISVGSYDFNARWQTASGQSVGYNLELGAISRYSNPGYRRDGRIKPDITAPGQWAISSLAEGSNMSFNSPHVVDTGKHIAWNGTSASAPYVAGIIALMFERNPTLDAAQILDILKKTAIEDDQTGTVPNPLWGYGRINPVMAVRQTPVP